jgi:hypothetical protein
LEAGLEAESKVQPDLELASMLEVELELATVARRGREDDAPNDLRPGSTLARECAKEFVDMIVLPRT